MARGRFIGAPHLWEIHPFVPRSNVGPCVEQLAEVQLSYLKRPSLIESPDTESLNPKQRSNKLCALIDANLLMT